MTCDFVSRGLLCGAAADISLQRAHVVSVSLQRACGVVVFCILSVCSEPATPAVIERAFAVVMDLLFYQCDVFLRVPRLVLFFRAKIVDMDMLEGQDVPAERD